MLALLLHNFVDPENSGRRSFGYACCIPSASGSLAQMSTGHLPIGIACSCLIMKQNFCAYPAHLIYTLFLKIAKQMKFRVFAFWLIMICLFVSCRETISEKKYFQTNDVDSAEIVNLFSIDTLNNSNLPFAHLVLDENSHTNEICISCHSDKTLKTELPKKTKGIHELHFNSNHPIFRTGHIGNREDFFTLMPNSDSPKLKCIFCHSKAGEKGFPELTKTSGIRSEYNKKCKTCHNRDENLDFKY